MSKCDPCISKCDLLKSRCDPLTRFVLSLPLGLIEPRILVLDSTQGQDVSADLGVALNVEVSQFV